MFKENTVDMLVFLSPLETEVWLSLGMAFIVVTFGVYFIERYVKTFNKKYTTKIHTSFFCTQRLSNGKMNTASNTMIQKEDQVNYCKIPC